MARMGIKPRTGSHSNVNFSVSMDLLSEMDYDYNSYIDLDFDSAKSGHENGSNKAVKPIRKKFAVPPVKVACLECRASRTRCDGGKPECTNCRNKGKSCVYTQSKRGGARIRKRRVSSSDSALSSDNSEFNHCALSILPELNQGELNPSARSDQTLIGLSASFAEPLSLVAPGGGLRQLDLSLDDTDFIFDSIFTTRQDQNDSGYDTSDHTGACSESEMQHTFIRVYSSEENILGAYYTYIHPYFPVLPPPESHQVTDNPDLGIRRAADAIFSSQSAPDFEPSTPLSLAISASLALIPHPDDPDPTGTDSVHLRREQAQAFAQSAFESIEIESELPDSVDRPEDALSSDPNPIERAPFHERVPVETESIIALLLLSTYEYAQRGNIAKMRNRAGQALNAALNLGLHAKGDEDGYFAEANRRTWWMTYITVCQGSILSNSPPPVLLYDPRFTTLGPTLSADTDAWTVFLQAQQVIVSATQFVIDLDVTLKTASNTSMIWSRMLELEGLIEPLIIKADTWLLESFPPVSLDRCELKVSQALRGIARIKLNSARIKLHRYCAFMDVPVFTKKHCDLKTIPPTLATSNLNSTPSSISENPTTDPTAPMPPNCGCSTTFHQLTNLTSSNITPTFSSNPTQPIEPAILPFSSNFSAKICLKAALAIARSFSSLPYPQPMRSTPNPNPNSAADSGMNTPSYFPPFPAPSTTRPPRMIPVFACCAMQSAYAMIMLSYKTKAMESELGMGGMGGYGEAAERLLGQLGEGLGMVVGALGNYGGAYEALGGQMVQIKKAAEVVGVGGSA